MWTNQRAAVRIWEFLFPPLLSEKYVSRATFRKVFLYLSLCGENVSRTIDLCGFLTFWRSWIPFYPCAEVKFRVLPSLEKCRCSALSKQPEEKKKPPFTILEPSASCSLWNGKKQSCSHGTHSDEVSNMFSLGMSWSFTHHCVRELSIGIQAKDFFISSKLQVLQGYYGDRVIWFSQAFRICNHNNNFERPVVNSLPLLAVSVINWKEEAGKKKEKSLIVAELMCFCLLWIVSSSPL